MERRDPQGSKCDGGFNTLIFQDSVHSEEDQVHRQPNQSRLKELTFYVGPGRRIKLAAVSLMGLASILLIVDIGLGVHYNNLRDTHLTLDDINLISKDLAQLQGTYKTAVENMKAARKQVDTETSLQTETQWEFEHQTKRSKDYEVQIDKFTKDVATMRTYLPMIVDGCRHCPLGWVLMNAACFYFSSNYPGLKTWQKAREFCQLNGGDLLIIDSKDKENSTINHVADHQGSLTSNVGFWLGLRDSQEEGTWKWVDGSFLVEGYWMDGEPNDTDNDEDCAELYPEKNLFKAWNDAECNTQRKWICHKALNLMS